jgi:hypothetical protein
MTSWRPRVIALALVVACAPMLWAAIPASDAFTGSDGDNLSTYSANWVDVAGQLGINGNGVIRDPDSALAQNYSHWAAGTDDFNDDQSSKATIVSGLSTNEYAMLHVRMQGTWGLGTLDSYYVYCNDASCILGEYQNTTSTDFACTRTAPTNGQTIKLSAEGAGNVTLKFYINDVQDGADCTDTGTYITGGQPGIGFIFTSASAKMDNWVGDNVSAGAAASCRLGLLGVGC